MPIEVRCPKGHLLQCPDERAGKQGKCPKCGTLFQVPQKNGQAAPAGGKPAAAPPKGDGSGKGQGSAKGQGSGKETRTATAAQKHIVFPCPNGHKLNGPASLQGQPGQCPHCGAKFRIPVFEPSEQIEGAPQDDGESTHIGEVGEYELDIEGAVEEELENEFDEELEPVEEFGLPEDAFGDRPAIDPFFGNLERAPDSVHPIARLFAVLWNERLHGGVLELHLEDGVTIVPDWWANRLSRAAYGVFALQAPDGSYVMETIAWDHVKRVTVRRINELPDGVFE